MPLEPNVTGIQDLNETWPLISDLLPEANEHLQNIKKGIRGSFANLAANGGTVTVTADELNALSGVTSNVQAQLDAKPESLIWTRPPAFSFGTGNTLYKLQPNTRSLIERNGTDSTLTVELPLISESSDKDTIEFKVVDIVFDANGFEILTPMSDQMRILGSDGTWSTASLAIINTVNGWPHFQMTFQDYFGVWVVRCLDQPVTVL